jgi:hypothetical protein
LGPGDVVRHIAAELRQDLDWSWPYCPMAFKSSGFLDQLSMIDGLST